MAHVIFVPNWTEQPEPGYDEARFQNNDVGNHQIVIRIRVFRNIEILLYNSSCI